MEQQKIRVQGHATVSKKPDIVVLSFTISDRDLKYEMSIEKVNVRVKTLRNDLIPFKIDTKSLKTTRFNISTDSKYDEKGKKYTFLGYVCTHGLRLELPFNKQDLGNIIDRLAVSTSHAEMRISFEIKDKEGLHKELMEKSILLAKQNAEILTKTAGVKLGSILNIEYGWGEIRIKEMDYRCEIVEECLAEIEPEDIEGEDSITVTWEILNK
jgi:uncharacterized protein YggE